MTQQFPSAIASLPMSNGCNISPMHQNSTCGAAENVGTAAKPNGIMHEPVRVDRPNAFSNNSSFVLSCIQTAVDIPSQSRKIDVPPNMFLGQPSNMGLRQTIDGRIIKTEPVYVWSLTRNLLMNLFWMLTLLHLDFLERCLKILVSQT
ncbi:hypothetical protein T459_35193 [Capsicum annuum]|uniref:Uncharacterized protein n=1 Tax=Capsicum annuum TaxID=4072 RepID=A0A2G2XTV9_CAPAN|nr:hypothetical protein T459_35193 [Capsicum annuum]